jgi:hypothetical protein
MEKCLEKLDKKLYNLVVEYQRLKKLVVKQQKLLEKKKENQVITETNVGVEKQKREFMEKQKKEWTV